jgi:hypothetical protein
MIFFYLHNYYNTSSFRSSFMCILIIITIKMKASLKRLFFVVINLSKESFGYTKHCMQIEKRMVCVFVVFLSTFWVTKDENLHLMSKCWSLLKLMRYMHTKKLRLKTISIYTEKIMCLIVALILLYDNSYHTCQ